ncbi:MAG: KGGVGR-motif variant AAA ATPase [Limisphaerales bacterium]
MALINTAGILAGRGFHVLVIDLDLEAPGLSYLNPDAPDVPGPAGTPDNRPLRPGFVDLLSDARERGQDGDLFTLPANDLANRYTQKYRLPEGFGEFTDGSLHIMPAGRFDADYARRFDALDLRALYQEGLGEPLIRVFKKRLAEAGLYDYVLVDSRTGFSDEAGICTRDLADHLMILTGLNRQNVEGTCQFLMALRSATGGKKRFQIILSPVPNGEDALLEAREAEARRSFEEAWGSQIDLSLQIPYHPQLALTEEPHIFRRRRGHLSEAYRNIEREMLQALGHNAQALSSRIQERLDRKDYQTALRDLQRMVRLDGGRPLLSRVVFPLRPGGWPSAPNRAWAEPEVRTVALEEILADRNGRRVIEFLVENVLPSDPIAVLLLGWLLVHSRRLAARLYVRGAGTDVRRAFLLADYADFLVDERGDRDGAEAYYKRAIEVDPKDAGTLGAYAAFLENKRGDKDGAEAYHRRAIEADPKNAHILRAYAGFLANKRGDTDKAEAYYKRAIEADPKSSACLCDYGQLLVGTGRLNDGQEKLLSALDVLKESGGGETAEVCFSLWLVSRMQGRDAARWEGYFKFLIQKGFARYPWSFDGMLEQAAKTLSPEENEYAKALALAFLDESKAPSLDRYERWRALEPRDPRSPPQAG